MVKSARMASGEFKAKCLAVLSDVQKSRRSIVITKRGKPVARVVPIEEDAAADALAGSVLFEDDIVGPAHDAWKARS